MEFNNKKKLLFCQHKIPFQVHEIVKVICHISTMSVFEMTQTAVQFSNNNTFYISKSVMHIVRKIFRLV